MPAHRQHAVSTSPALGQHIVGARPAHDQHIVGARSAHGQLAVSTWPARGQHTVSTRSAHAASTPPMRRQHAVDTWSARRQHGVGRMLSAHTSARARVRPRRPGHSEHTVSAQHTRHTVGALAGPGLGKHAKSTLAAHAKHAASERPAGGGAAQRSVLRKGQSDPATPAGSQHSCRPTEKLHVLPLVWNFPLGKG